MSLVRHFGGSLFTLWTYQLNVTVMLLASISSVHLKTYGFAFMINGEISSLIQRIAR